MMEERMAVEIRAARPEEMEEFRRVASTALGMPVESFKEVRPEWTLCAFEDGRLATTYAYWPLTMRFNGEGIPVAGVTSVGTMPIFRRRGYLRRITSTHFNYLHESGEYSIAILLASLAAIYQRYGYAIVSTRNMYNVEPRYLEFAVDQPVPGKLRELGDDEFGLLVELYRRFRADRTGYIHRGRAMWEAGVLNPPPAGSQLLKVVYEEAGEPLGYVIYVLAPLPGGSPDQPRQRLVIRDLVWLSPSAYWAIWQHFAAMDLVNNIVWQWVPSDDPLPHLLREPRMLRLTAQDGILARIVDVARAFPQLRFLGEGNLTFEVMDDLCPWNRGRWQVEVTAEGTAITRTKEEPQLTLPISTLAMLVFGQISATEAARMGRLAVQEESALPVWDGVMCASYRPFCADLF
jgi:predicted acetyltransferase